MKPSVYIETSIISYYTARPSAQLIAAAWQHVTHKWWDLHRLEFDLFTSELVLKEAASGDPKTAKSRLDCLADIALLPLTEQAENLARVLISKGGVPPKENADALHIAIAAAHNMDYLVTWNCKHIDNAQMKPKIRAICAIEGYKCPEICSPQELMGA